MEYHNTKTYQWFPYLVYNISSIIEEKNWGVTISVSLPMKIYRDNKATISIAHNLVVHDRTMHIELTSKTLILFSYKLKPRERGDGLQQKIEPQHPRCSVADLHCDVEKILSFYSK